MPISLRYSNRATDLFNLYGRIPVLPVIMVKQLDEDTLYQPGLDKLKEIIIKRVEKVNSELNLETEVFENKATLDRLCIMSGGHVRQLIQLMQEAINNIDSLPITAKAAQRSIGVLKNTYTIAIQEDQWSILREVAQSKAMPNGDRYQVLLLSRCLLEYVTLDEQGEIKIWHDVHPVVKEIPKFNQ